CIARAAMSISGTKKSPFSKRRPTSSREGIRALNRMSIGLMPRPSASSVRALTSGAWPYKVRSNRPAPVSPWRLPRGASDPAGAEGESAALAVLIGDVIGPIVQATASASVVGVNWLGRRTPVHCTASGKVITAFAPDAVRERLLALPLDRVTPHTIIDRKQLEAQLEEVRTAGVAGTNEELEVGLDAVAAPVFGADGEVLAALDVSGPSQRL